MLVVVALWLVAGSSAAGATNQPDPAPITPPGPVQPACPDTAGVSYWDDVGAGVIGTCWGNSAGAPEWRGVSSEAVWNWAGCDVWRPWTPGSQVVSLNLNGGTRESSRLLLEDIVARGLDPTVEYYWYWAECEHHSTDDPPIIEYWSGGLIVIGETAPVDPIAMRDTAAARINPDPPTPMSSPMWSDVPSVVQVPTWLWVPEEEWVVTEEDEEVGFVTVVVQARPVELTWDMGDGATVLCKNGPGIEWSPGADDAATYCKHTFTSMSERYDAQLTMTWRCRWWLNGNDMGDFTDLSLTTTLSFPVAEIQAIESS